MRSGRDREVGDKGRDSKRSTSRTVTLWGIGPIVLIALSAGGYYCVQWRMAAASVERAADYPASTITWTDLKRIEGVIERDPQYVPPWAAGLSERTQSHIVRAAVAGELADEEVYDLLLVAVTVAYHERGMFATLPDEVNAAMRDEEGDLYDVFLTTGLLGMFDRHLDVRYALTQLEDERAVIVALCHLSMERLAQDRNACFELLERDGMPKAKGGFLLKVLRAGPRSAVDWFAEQEELLTVLATSEDEDLRKRAEEIQEVLREVK